MLILVSFYSKGKGVAMMIKTCPKCGDFDIYSQYCGRCGKMMVELELPMCNQCGKVLFPFMSFCSACGRSRKKLLLPPSPPNKIRQFFVKLFGGKKTTE